MFCVRTSDDGRAPCPLMYHLRVEVDAKIFLLFGELGTGEDYYLLRVLPLICLLYSVGPIGS